MGSEVEKEALAARLKALNCIPAWGESKDSPSSKSQHSRQTCQVLTLHFPVSLLFKMHHRKASSNTEDHGLENYYFN